tara:strand:- start:91 stop:468 length:378 start_codon:yes stop_codon:yes gene_type:complete
MDIISLITGFVLGLLFYRLFRNILGVTYAALFFRQAEKHCLMMLISVAEAISYIQQIKYNSMVEAEVPEKTIILTKNIDKQNFELWKSTVITNLTSNYPKTLRPAYGTWEEALKLLDKIYNRKHT